ncbi:hypothetical protein [Lacinutrix himadriensis]|uniref:hypothetical protein n=1 Tax=Lacinutrix himadriensis TaxID=641549 RepID=UPI0013792335|nr:hypothetical protein [Lacinutrix himadriensis]
MKNLKNLGKALSKAEQKEVNGGYPKMILCIDGQVPCLLTYEGSEQGWYKCKERC